MKTRDEGDLERIKMKYGEAFIHALVKAPVGSGMIQNAAWNRGNPYYITFRPILHSVERLTDEELDKYNQFNDIVDDLDFQFEQLEKEQGQDVFDLRLELKLSKDKIKSGNFNMVKIYLDGLTPRVEKLWQKLGKKPKKRTMKLINVDDLKADLVAAKKSSEEAAKKAADDAAKAESEKKEEVKEEKAIDPELAAANWTSVGELRKQTIQAAKGKDWSRANELIMEITSTPVGKEKAPEKAKIVEDLKKEVEEIKNPPKKEEKKDGEKKETGKEGETKATPGEETGTLEDKIKAFDDAEQELNQAIQAGDGAKAKEAFSKMQGIYQALPDEEKQKVQEKFDKAQEAAKT